MQKAISEQKPMYIGFASAAAALAHREGAGGWIFVPDNAAGGIWFDGSIFTPSAILRHPAANGSGRLV